MKDKNKFNIEHLKNELQNIVADYNNIDNSFVSPLQNDPFDNIEKSLENENKNLINEINDIKNRLSEKLNSLSSDKKFEYLINKFMEFYSDKNIKSSNLKNVFENFVNDELSISDFNNIETPNIELKMSNEDKKITSEMENLFENQLKEIRDIQKSKSNFINEIISNMNPNDVSNENVVQSICVALDSIKNDFKIELNYLSSKLSKFSNKNSNVYSFKENIFNLISESIEDLKKEFTTYVSFNKFLNEKISSINENNLFKNKPIRKDYEEIETRISEVIKSNLKNNDFSDDKYTSLEAKIEKLINLVGEMNDNNKIIESKTSEIIDKKINELEEKFNVMLSSIDEKNENSRSEDKENSKKAIENLSSIVASIKNENNEFVTKTQQNIEKILKSNDNEKKYIIDLLNKIHNDNENAINEESLNISLINSEKLMQLENLIVKQNSEIEELLSDKNEALDTIEQMLVTSKNENASNDDFYNISENIQNISHDLQNKILDLEQKFVDKLENITSTIISSKYDSAQEKLLVEEIMSNIQSVENRLLQNYETIKLNFNDSFSEIVNRINDSKDKSISSKIDELLNDVGILKDTNRHFGLGNDIKAELQELLSNNDLSNSNLKEEIRNEVKRLIESNSIENTEKVFDKKLIELDEKFENLISTINESNNNKILEEKENTNKIVEKLSLLIESIKSEKNDFAKETREYISSIIKNNENEKKYIVSILNKIQEDNEMASSEEELNRVLVNSERLHQLENLIIKQNNELEELLKDKNEAFNYIEEILSNTKNNENNLKHETFSSIENNVEEVINNLENKINNFERVFINKIESINREAPNVSHVDNVNTNEILNSISSVENKLIQNYESIKNNFIDSFNEIINRLNETKESILNDKIDSLINEVVKLKDDRSQFGLGNEIKDEIRDIFSQEIHDRFSKFIDEKINNDFIVNKISTIENKLSNLMEDINNKNKEEFNSLSNKLDNLDYFWNTIVEKISYKDEDYKDIEEKLFENFKKYEEILVHAINKDKENYYELKDMIKTNFLEREAELSAAELNKLQSLNYKLDNLANLIDLQEKEISNLIEEKDLVLSKLNSGIDKTNANNIFDMQQILEVIENKISECINRVLESPNNLSHIYKSNDYNELTQMNEKVDELSNYIHENMDIYKNKNNISEILDLDLFNNFSNIDFLIKKVESISNSINEISLNKTNDYDLNFIQDKLNQLKFNLVDVELDVSLVKHKLNAYIEVNNLGDDNRYKELLLINKKKLDIIVEILNRSKESLKELFVKKDQYIENLNIEKPIQENNDKINESKEDINSNDIELLVEAKVNLVIDKLIDELKTNQNNEISLLNKKFEDLNNQIIAKQKENISKLVNEQSDEINDYSISLNENNLVSEMSNEDAEVVNEIIDKLTLLEENLKYAFDSLENKNKELLIEIENKVDNEDAFNRLVQKFEEEKEQIKNDYINETNNFKEYILSLKNQEIDKYRDQLVMLEKQLSDLKNSNNEYSKINNEKNTLINNLTFERDEAIEWKENSLVKYKEKIDTLGTQIESLIFQIDSFQEEKEALFQMMLDKLNYIDKLNNPISEDDFIELETDNISIEKFKKIISEDTIKIIEEKFDSLRENVSQDLNKIINEIHELKENKSANKEDVISQIKDMLNSNSNAIESNEFEKMIKNSEITLKLINDSILNYVFECERRKKEIDIFYKKIRNLRNSIEE